MFGRSSAPERGSALLVERRADQLADGFGAGKIGSARGYPSVQIVEKRPLHADLHALTVNSRSPPFLRSIYC